MSDNVHPPSPSGPSLPAADLAAPPAESSSNVVTAAVAAVAVADAGTSNDMDGVAPSISMASSTGPSPSSSQQPSPSPSGAKYENSKELKQLRDKLENLGLKSGWNDQAEMLRSADAVFSKYHQILEELLLNLDPAHSTVGIIFTIGFMLDAAYSRKNDKEMIRVSEILKSYVDRKAFVREQVMAAIDVYTKLFLKVTHFLVHKEEFANGIPFMTAGIDVLVDADDQTVTPLHANLFTLCLKAHAIGPGLTYLYPYVKGIMSDYNPGLSPPSYIDSRPLLSYLYYGALLTARAGQWKRSASLLKAACFVPGYAVSEIQIEALKKLHIISFIADGKMSMPARSPNFVKAWKQLGSHYAQLAAEMEGGTVSEWDDEGRSFDRNESEPLSTEQIAERAKIVQKFMTTNKKVYEKDQNVELLMILQHECKLRAVLKVAELYKVVSLARITEMAKLENVEETKQILTTLIEGGRLLVSDDGDDFVRLEQPPITQALPEINERQQRLAAITEDVKRLDLVAKKTSWYITRTAKSGHPNDDEGLSMSNIPEHFAAPAAPTSVPT